jgi:dihydroorotase
MLYVKDAPKENLIVRGARVLDPVEGLDSQVDVKVDDGVIAELGSNLPQNSHKVIDGTGLVLGPAFVDPHVHLRTPGREDEETITTGTRAAAAGGYCAILAMPNTDPVIDSAAVLGALVEQARDEAEVQVGFLAAISKGQEGSELTEMGELADQGAVGFTDDGRPVVATALMWRALQYASITDRPIAVHCEDPTLSRGGHMHEGVVSAELGIGGWPSIAESVMVERDLALALYESRTLHLMHLSARASVEALRRAHAAGVRATAEVTPHHLVLTDDAVRGLDPNVKMNPPLVAEDDLKSRSKNSWLIGEKLRGRVRATIAAGRLVHES